MNKNHSVKKPHHDIKKANVVKNDGYIRHPRQPAMIPCPSSTIKNGNFCEDRITHKKTEQKHKGCESNEDVSKGLCYPKCKQGYFGKDNHCLKIEGKNQYLEAMKRRQIQLALHDASKRKDHFSNVASEWLSYNKLDKALSDLFDDNLKQYRWLFVVCLAILVFFVIVNLLQSPNVEVKAPQQPTIIVQIPSTGLQVPQQVIQPAVQSTSSPVAPQQIIQVPETQVSPVKSDIPIKITDLKKTGGFNKNIFSEIETSIFSDWNMSD